MGERDSLLWFSDSLVSNFAKTRSQSSLLRHSPQDPQVHRVYGRSRGSALIRSSVMDTSVRACFNRTSTTPSQTLSDTSSSGTCPQRAGIWSGERDGSRAYRFRCEVLGGGDSRQYKSVSVKRESGLGRKSEQCADEVSLADHISISQPSHSALPDHVHGLDTLQRPPRTLKGSIALGQPNSLFDRPVVLFNHVIEILALA